MSPTSANPKTRDLQAKVRRHGRRLGGLLQVAAALLLLACTGRQAHAGCSFNSGNSTGIYSVSLPATISIDPNAAPGATIYTSSPTPVVPVVYFSCSGNGNAWGLQNVAGAAPAPNDKTFPTGVTGVGYRVLQKSAYIYSYPYFSLDGSGSWYESDAVTIELVKTGPIANGSVLQAGTLADFRAGSSGTSIIDASIRLASKVVFVSPSCQVSNSSITVMLPTVSTNAFGSGNLTAGTTPFRIDLLCSSGSTLKVTLDSSASSGVSGVMNGTTGTGYATGMGVQLLDAGGNAITFGSAATIGATPNGALSVNYFARYYRTAGVLGSGQVKATATFTLSYN